MTTAGTEQLRVFVTKKCDHSKLTGNESRRREAGINNATADNVQENSVKTKLKGGLETDNFIILGHNGAL